VPLVGRRIVEREYSVRIRVDDVPEVRVPVRRVPDDPRQDLDQTPHRINVDRLVRVLVHFRLGFDCATIFRTALESAPQS